MSQLISFPDKEINSNADGDTSNKKWNFSKMIREIEGLSYVVVIPIIEISQGTSDQSYIEGPY